MHVVWWTSGPARARTKPGIAGFWRSSRARPCAGNDRWMPRRRSRLAPSRCRSTMTLSIAAMACVTIHHWEPPEAGLAEMRRIARSRVVVFTFELDRLPAWQQDYLAEALAIRRGAEACRRLATIGAAFPDRTRRRRSRARRLWPGSRAGSRVFSSGTRHVSRSMGSRRPVNRRSRERSPGRWATLAGR